MAKANDIKLKTFHEMEQSATKRVPHIVPKPESIFTICFTSGTTGYPKGVMLSFKAAISVAGGFLDAVPEHLMFKSNDCHLSFVMF